jgi:hypothetical protein
MNGPDFVGIGVQRGGTSWLYQCFKEHPGIYMPGKEIHFFDQKYDKGMPWYESLFSEGNEQLVKGEMTPDYLFNPEAIVRLSTHYPNAKLILILRNPYERAYSAVGLLRGHGRHQGKSFREIIAKERWIIDQSLYYKQLVHLFEHFAKNPLYLLESAFNFIEVDPKFVPKTFADKYNISGTSTTFGGFSLDDIQKNLEKNALGQMVLKLKKFRFVKNLKNKLSTVTKQTDIKETQFTQELIKEIKQDIVKTEGIVNIELKHWYEQ